MANEERMIGPAEAADLLRFNTSNRRLDHMRRARYAQDMRDGAWLATGIPIILYKRGSDLRLEDGQHRLQAVIDSGATLPFTISVVNEPVRDVVDSGKARTIGDLIKMENSGADKMGVAVAASALAVLEYRDNPARYIAIGPPQRKALADAHPAETAFICRMTRAVRLGVRRKLAVSYAAGMLTCYRAGGASAERFFALVAAGEEMRRGDPAYALRARMIETKSRGTNLETVRIDHNATVRAYNYWCTGQAVLILRPGDGWLAPLYRPEVAAAAD
jgi:hypothetical protein